MRSFRFAAISILALVGATPSLAQWTLRNQGLVSEAFTPNTTETAALVLQCQTAGPVLLKVVMPQMSGWAGNLAAAFEVDGTGFAATVYGFEEGVILSDAGTDEMGLTAPALSAIGAGSVLLLSGPAAQGMSEADRSFDLAGSDTAIEYLSAQ